MKAIAILTIIFSASNAWSAAECTEKVTRVINHKNTGIYFQTDKTCSSNWCQISWGTEAANNRGFSILLTAKTTDKTATFYWPELNSCDSLNPVYKSPEYIIL